MASITTWTRLETRQRTDDLDVSLAAGVHDPLWLLARQWQLGELRGHDAGTPVGVAVRASSGRLDRYLVGGVDDEAATNSRPYDEAVAPLEAVVEAEPLSTANAPRLAVETGAHFLRMLSAADLGGHRQAFVDAFASTSDAPAAELDPAGSRFQHLVARRVPDGLVLRGALGDTGDPVLPAGVDVGADGPAVLAVVRRWLDWMAPFVHNAPDEDSWAPERLEHSFAVAAVVDGTEQVLAAEEYSAGRLDWHDFDVARSASLGATSTAEAIVRTVLPAPVTFPGMPAPRFWAFEDARIDLGAVGAGADNVARMLLVGFAVDYGNDWFVVPVELPVGSLTRITSLEVTDTFGVTREVRSANEVDGPAAAWRMFGLSSDDGTVAPLLFVPPVLSSSLEAAARERVAFARDEFANLVWAIEELVESPTGAPRRRDEEPQPPSRTSVVGDDVLRYEVATESARHWHPLVTVTDETGAATLEQRAIHPALGTVLGADRAVAPPRGGTPRRRARRRAHVPTRPLDGRSHRRVVGSPAHRRQWPGVERPALRRNPQTTPRQLLTAFPHLGKIRVTRPSGANSCQRLTHNFPRTGSRSGQRRREAGAGAGFERDCHHFQPAVMITAPRNEPIRPLGRICQAVAGDEAEDQPADERPDKTGDERQRPVDAGAITPRHPLRHGTNHHSERNQSKDQHGAHTTQVLVPVTSGA